MLWPLNLMQRVVLPAPLPVPSAPVFRRCCRVSLALSAYANPLAAFKG